VPVIATVCLFIIIIEGGGICQSVSLIVGDMSAVFFLLRLKWHHQSWYFIEWL